MKDSRRLELENEALKKEIAGLKRELDAYQKKEASEKKKGK